MSNPSKEPPASSKALNQDSKDMDVLCTFKIIQRAKSPRMDVSKTIDHIKIKIKIATPVRKLQHPLKIQIRIQKSWIFFAPSI